VLVNLGAAAPAASPQLARIVELVSAETAKMQQARARWRIYEARGLSPQHHRSAGAD
jgi:DNA polymerase IIIc chi subunit